MAGGNIWPDRRTLAIQMMAAAAGALAIGIGFILGGYRVAGVVILFLGLLGIVKAARVLWRR